MIVNLIFFFIFSLCGFYFNFNLTVYLGFLLISLMFILLLCYSESYYFDSLFYYDSVSVRLVILSVWVRLLMIFSSHKICRFSEFNKYFLFFVFFLLFILSVSFLEGGIFIFIFFLKFL